MITLLLFLVVNQQKENFLAEMLVKRVVEFNHHLIKKDKKNMGRFHTSGSARTTMKIRLKSITIKKVRIYKNRAIVYGSEKGRFLLFSKFDEDFRSFWILVDDKWSIDDYANSKAYDEVYWKGKSFKYNIKIER